MSRIGPSRATQSTPSAGFRRPGRVIAGVFAAAVLIGTGLLSLPMATASGKRADFLTALFQATSAVCVTGLGTQDVGTYWSGFGQAVVLVLIQLGGLGIMTLAVLFALLVSRRLGLRTRLVAQLETKALTPADFRRVIIRIGLFSLACEAAAALVLTVRFATGYGRPLRSAIYSGVFHGISAFNNAGISLNADSLRPYVSDPWISLTVVAAVLAGGLGFPVWFELARSWRRPKTWSVLTRITVIVTVAMMAVGTLGYLVVESNNPGTLGRLHDPGDKVMAAFVAAVLPSTAGFSTLDISALRPETLLLTDGLMFIGSGSAGTAGGIKVTTFGLLAYMLWAELRGDPDVQVGRRRVPATNQRQALGVALLGIGLVAIGTFFLLAMTHFRLDQVLFEAVSAFGTVGLSTGITADLPPAGQVLVIVLMYIGRIGPLTLASGLALRERARLYRLPEERTIVG